jgi:hypothetical protein
MGNAPQREPICSQRNSIYMYKYQNRLSRNAADSSSLAKPLLPRLKAPKASWLPLVWGMDQSQPSPFRFVFRFFSPLGSQGSSELPLPPSLFGARTNPSHLLLGSFRFFPRGFPQSSLALPPSVGHGPSTPISFRLLSFFPSGLPSELPCPPSCLGHGPIPAISFQDSSERRWIIPPRRTK